MPLTGIHWAPAAAAFSVIEAIFLDNCFAGGSFLSKTEDNHFQAPDNFLSLSLAAWIFKSGAKTFDRRTFTVDNTKTLLLYYESIFTTRFYWECSILSSILWHRWWRPELVWKGFCQAEGRFALRLKIKRGQASPSLTRAVAIREQIVTQTIAQEHVCLRWGWQIKTIYKTI